jgi:hypothetical protein
MPIYNFRTVKESSLSAHQLVLINDQEAGEIWREQTHVVVSKLTEPRKMVRKWRWYAKRLGEQTVLGKGTRAAMLMGGGFSSKVKAAEQLYLGREDQFK